MARIKDSSVEAVRQTADMLDVVGARTQLRKQGARHVGRCPFHEERTPSFSVNAQDKLFYCFGCGKGGDLITFVRETENLDFAGAIEWLADRFRVPLEYEEVSPKADAERRRRERLHELLASATSFYERYLWESTAGEPVRAYLEGRGLGEPVCREFRLGLAPAGGRTLTAKAHERGFTGEELLATGLVNRRGNDYFRSRLMFPLADARGRVLGFQARRLADDDPLPAKYVNSPEGELFQKGSMLYGLDLARAAIAKQDRAIVVEGNTDVIALRQAGLEPVVASMGTALTERQLKEIRVTKRLFLCFDADAAGEAATLRGMELAVSQGFDVRVVALPPGLDPADSAAGFEGLLEGAEGYLVHRVRLEHKREPDRRRAAALVEEFLPQRDSVERQEAVRVASDLLQVPPQFFAPRSGVRGEATSPSLKVLDAEVRRERDALAGVVGHPDLLPYLAELTADHFDLELHRRVREHLLEPGTPDEELVGLLAELDARAAAEEIDEQTTKELLLRLRERGLRRELARTDDLERAKELQEQLGRIREAVAALT